jgi:KDO2-lipid IV(A) lauroyltransferase
VVAVTAPDAATLDGRSALPLATPRWYAHRLNRAAVYRLSALGAAALPRPARLRVAALVGRALAPVFPAERAAIARAMARIAPDATGRARARLVTAVFRHFAMCFADLVATNRRPAVDRLLARIDAGADFDALAGRGLVVLTAHLGNWELGGRLLARRLGRPPHIVVAAEADPAVERFLRGGGAPVRFVVRDDAMAALPLIGTLRAGGVVAMQGDRAIGHRSDVATPFFGAPAAFPLGPFLLARAARVPVVPCFCVLGRDRRYVVTIGAPIDVEPGGEPAAVVPWVGALERAVAAHPEQWFNFFDVWSDVPAG